MCKSMFLKMKMGLSQLGSRSTMANISQEAAFSGFNHKGRIAFQWGGTISAMFVSLFFFSFSFLNFFLILKLCLKIAIFYVSWWFFTCMFFVCHSKSLVCFLIVLYWNYASKLLLFYVSWWLFTSFFLFVRARLLS